MVVEPEISNPLPVGRPFIRTSGGAVCQFLLVNPVKRSVENKVGSVGSELCDFPRTERQRVNVVLLHKGDAVARGRKCRLFFALRVVCQPLCLACANIKQPEIISALE